MNQEKYMDRETDKEHPDARSLINAYIARFSERVSGAVRSDISFKPLDDDCYSCVARGSATVGISLAEGEAVILFSSHIMDVPKKDREPFYRRLLELNYLVTNQAAFGIDRTNDAVYLRAVHSTAGLDYQEFEEMLHTVATVADEWDNRLIEEF
jgi:hypothetical protein